MKSCGERYSDRIKNDDHNAMMNPIIFYGGQIIDIQGEISYGALDKILDMIDNYIDLVEQV